MFRFVPFTCAQVLIFMGPALCELLRNKATVCALVVILSLATIATLMVWAFIPQWYRLGAFFWYFIPGTYLPQEPAVVYMGSVYGPLVVTVVAGLSTLVAASLDYLVIKRVVEIKGIRAIKRTGFYETAVRCFNKRPWETVIIFAFLPVPFYPIRFLALSSGYSARGYISASVIGRIPRYYLLAMGGVWVTISVTHLVLITLAVSCLIMLVMVYWQRRPASAKSLA